MGTGAHLLRTATTWPQRLLQHRVAAREQRRCGRSEGNLHGPQQRVNTSLGGKDDRHRPEPLMTNFNYIQTCFIIILGHHHLARTDNNPSYTPTNQMDLLSHLRVHLLYILISQVASQELNRGEHTLATAVFCSHKTTLGDNVYRVRAT